MMNINKKLAMMALLAGTALATSPTYAQDQSGSGAMDAPAATQDQGGSSEELLNQNQATSGEDAAMPDAAPTDQAATEGAQDPATQTQDQATTEELQDPSGNNQDQATSPASQSDTDDVAQEPTTREQDQTTADQQRQDDDAEQDTATDTRSKTDDMKSAEGDKKKDGNQDQASSGESSDDVTGSIDISAEQKTVIKNTIVQSNVKPVDVDVKVSIGVSVPKTIEVHPLPPKVVEILPAYSDYAYFVMADGRIVIVEPSTYEVVYILVV